jgi:hypothetical protein
MDDLRESDGAVERLWARLEQIEGQLQRHLGEAAALAQQAEKDEEPGVDTDLKVARLQRAYDALNAARQQALAAIDELVVALPEDRALAERAARLHRLAHGAHGPDFEGPA